MATSLADLFAADSPPRTGPRSPSPRSRESTPGPGPARRPNNTLFLSPGGSEASPAAARRRTWDDMNGADDAPPDFDFDAPDFDIDAFERDVTPMDVAELDRLQSQIRAGTGAPGTGGEADPFADPFAVQDPMVGPEGEGEPPKKRRPIAKVDADRLLGKDGYPALIRMARKWKPKGKGHEVRDLNRVLDMYQMWAHTMFPKGQFMFTVERIDKVARTAVVRNTLQGIREAFHNPQAITSAEYELEESIPTEASVLADMESQREHGITVVGSTGPTSGPQPLFTERDDDYDDDFEDELAAMEEMERGATQHRPLGSVDFGGAPYDDDMDEIAAVEEAEREAANATSATSASNGAKRTTAEESEFAFDGPEDVDPRKAAAAAATKRANGSAANGSESNATTANRSASASNGSASNGAADANVNDTRPPVSFGDEPPQLDEEDEWEGLYD